MIMIHMWMWCVVMMRLSYESQVVESESEPEAPHLHQLLDREGQHSVERRSQEKKEDEVLVLDMPQGVR